MAGIGNGYGSEWHLLRFLGRHRGHLDRLILERLPGQRLDWLDFTFDRSKPSGDGEITGLRFLDREHPAVSAWTKLWPASGSAQNWDAVARIDGRGWLLVEAKANVEELKSACKAASPRSLQMIEGALDNVRSRLGANPSAVWTSPFYQLANRLVVLDHLVRHGEDAHLLLIYFCGDRTAAGRNCPGAPEAWEGPIREQEAALGLPARHELSDRIHKLFVPVDGPAP